MKPIYLSGGQPQGFAPTTNILKEQLWCVIPYLPIATAITYISKN